MDNKNNQIQEKGKFSYVIVQIPQSFTSIDISNYLRKNKINLISINKIKIFNNFYNYIFTVNEELSKEKIEELKWKELNNEQPIEIYKINIYDNSLVLIEPKPHDRIEYSDYYKSLSVDYKKKFGKEGFIFNNQDLITKQRNIAGYYLKEISKNIINGKPIINLPFPIELKDSRSMLEFWIYQNAYCDEYLEKASNSEDLLSKIKYVSIFSLTRLHLFAYQKKPYIPILGETFQCEIGNSKMYLEYTSNKPHTINFYVLGKNYKIYGYNLPNCIDNLNILDLYSKGKYIIKFFGKNTEKFEIFCSPQKIKGITLGERELVYSGYTEVIDRYNGFFSYILINPDNRNLFEKLTKKKKTFPDHIEGIITKNSNSKFDENEQIYKPVDFNKHILGKITGEFSNYLKFDNEILWKYNENNFPFIYRQNFTLKSDSYYREDIYFFKQKNTNLSDLYYYINKEREEKDAETKIIYINEKLNHLM